LKKLIEKKKKDRGLHYAVHHERHKKKKLKASIFSLWTVYNIKI